MKKLFNVSLLLLIHLSGISLTGTTYIKLKGKIGENLSITMDITKTQDASTKKQTISGSYYYDRIGLPIDINGTLTDAGNIELTESNSKGDVTGTFKGTLSADNRMQGVWINPKTKKETPFALTEATENIAQFDYTEYSNENCDKKKRNLKSTRKDTLQWTDTLCSEVTISMLAVKNLNPTACIKINTLMEKILLQAGMTESPYKTMKDLLHHIDKPEDDYTSTESYGIEVVSNESNVLCLSISYYGYAEGAAHPNGYSTYFNLNPQTGDTIVLNDILIAGANDSLIAKAKRKFIATNGSLEENDWFFGNEFKLSYNFAITKGGLLFQHNTYEAGAYALGAPQFFIPNKELEGVVKPQYLK